MNLFTQKELFSLGLTGTHKGMRDRQKLVVQTIVGFLLPNEAHHGDCIGSDADFHDIVRAVSSAVIIVHPPINPKKRANKQGDFILTPKDYMVRDDDIIAESHLMLATPFEFDERGRGSGTWAVIRHTRKARKPLIIIWPDGTYTPEGNLQFSEKCDRMLTQLSKTNFFVN